MKRKNTSSSECEIQVEIPSKKMKREGLREGKKKGKEIAVSAATPQLELKENTLLEKEASLDCTVSVMTAQHKKTRGYNLLLSVSPFVSLVTVILCVGYMVWLQNATFHINELGKRRMLTHRNLETVLEYAIFNKSSHPYAFADAYIASPDNTEYTRNVHTFFALFEELIELDQQSEFETLYFRTVRAADAVVQSVNRELDDNASATMISATFLTFVCAAIVIVAASLNMLVLTRRLLREVQDNLTAHNKRLDTLPIMVYEFSMENGTSTFDYTSKAVHKIYGTDISAAQVAIDMIHESERAGFIDSMDVSSKQLTPWIWKGPITNALGEEKIISFQSVPERVSATRVTWTGAVQDITNLHVALQTMERRLEFVPVFELVVHGDGSTEVRYITTVAADILGHKQKTPGFDILTYIAEADRERVIKTLTGLTKNPAPGKKWLQEFTTVAGRRVRACANSHLNNRGDTVWTGVLEDVGMQHDLTRVRRERDLQKTVAEQLKTRCNFLAHEVRNTLFPHNMMLEDMKERYPDSQQNVELMLAGYRTVGDVLDRALMIAKYEAGEMTTKSIRFNLVALCRSLEAYAAAAVARNANQHVEVVYDLPDGAEDPPGALWVVGDRQVCEQATTNLLSNAVKYGGGKPFKIRLSHDGEVFTFTVTDNGRGMTEEGLKTACVPFGTIRTGNDQTKGTGLGLPLTHAMIMNAGGSLTLQSEGLGHGTVATIRLPLSRSTDSGQKGINKQEGCEELPAWVNECKNSPLPCRVLLVDDSPLVLKMMQHLCRKVGIEYDSATNGETALKLMTQQHKRYSLVLMDRSMPDLQGDVVCQRARAAGYKGVVVLLTGDQIPDPTSMIQQFGLSGVLCKSGQQPSAQTILKHLAV